MKKIYLICFSAIVMSSARAGTVIINPGDDISAIVNANPPGTTYIVKAGLYRQQWIKPKNDDIFIADPGVVLNGSMLLTSFSQEGNYWVATGQTQEGQLHGECDPGRECKSPEDLFFDDVPLMKVGTLAEVAFGKWFFDYANDKIYFLDDPTGKKVETSVTRHAFESDGDRVTIKGFIVEKYACPAQQGAIHARLNFSSSVGTHWLIENNEVRLNHGVGISFSDYAIVRSNYVHDNGELGIGGTGKNCLVEDNEISHNCEYAGFNWYWEGGGTKFALTDSLIVRNNFSHHNAGAGLWTDIDNIHTLYEGNLVEDNTDMGIHHEISYDAIIRCNTLNRNGILDGTWLWGVQISVAASQNVRVYNNTLVVDPAGGNGIGLIQQNRGTGAYGPYLCLNDSVYDNEIYFMGDNGSTGAVMDCNCNPSFYTTNYFSNNIYHDYDQLNDRWAWNDAWNTLSTMQSLNKEQGSTMDGNTTATPMVFANCAGAPTNTSAEKNVGADLTLLPNPTTTYIQLTGSIIHSAGQIKIYNAFGQELTTYKLSNNPAQTFDVSALTNGIYFLRLESENNSVMKKFVVQH